MAVVIPTRIAIYVMAGVAVVYFTVFVVLIAVYIGCHMHHKKSKKAPGPGAPNPALGEVEEEIGSGDDRSDSVTLDVWSNHHSSAGSGDNNSAQQEANGKKLYPKQLRPSIDSSQSDLPPLKKRPSPSKLTQLPPLSNRPPEPNLPLTSESVKAHNVSTLPRLKDTEQEYTVLSVHKSTLRRIRKSAKIEPTEESISENNSELGHSSHESKEGMKLKPLKDISKKPKVQRTESTKPLMEHLEEDDSPLSEQIPGTGDVDWCIGRPTTLTQEDGLVLENTNTQDEEKDERSLNALQSDIIDMITAL